MRRKRRRRFKQFNFKVNPKVGWWASLIFCCLILLIGLGYAIYASSVFKVGEGDIRSNMPLSRDLRERIKGKSLFSLDIKSISSKLLRTNPEYKEIYVYREFPSTVVVEATKRIPFAQIKDRRYYPVDKEAVIINEGKLKPLDGLIPLEIGEYRRSLKKGSNIKSEQLEYAFSLIDALRDQGFLETKGQVKLINSSQLDAVYFTFTPLEKLSLTGFTQESSSHQDWSLDEGIKIIVGKGDFERKLKLFKDLIDQELKGKMSSVNYIDLRFKRVYMDFKR